MTTQELNNLAQRVHKANEKWWQDPSTGKRVERNKGELLMLVITELSEACEGERKNLMDDKLPHRRMAEVEMADAYIRLLDFAAGFSLNIAYMSIDEFDHKFPLNKGEALLHVCSSIGIYALGPLIPIPLNVVVTSALAMIEKYCQFHNYDLMGALEEKLAYNATREDHKHEARLQAGGKQW